MTDARSNIELKARLDDLPAARQVALRLATEQLDLLEQVDTYFHCPRGRLKLREQDRAGEAPTAQLIAYVRANEQESRESRYHLVDVTDAAGLKAALSASLGVRVEVAKRRELFLYHNVRIHLDQVRGLGTFLEFEAVLSEDIDPQAGHRQVAQLRQEFGIADEQLIDTSYGDLLAK